MTVPAYWNYRILYDGDVYWIGEVYYNEADQPEAFIAESATDTFDRLEDLMTTITHVANALTKPVIRVDDDHSRILGEMGVLK